MRHGQFNRTLGWSLLIAGFLCAAWLDPGALGERAPVVAGTRTAADRAPLRAARHAQAVMLGMALLQLLVAEVLASGRVSPARRFAAGLTAVGALVYTLGYALSVAQPASAWLIPFGALTSFLGFLVLSSEAESTSRRERIILSVICLGMLLDAGMGLFVVGPKRFLPVYLGPEDGVRLRMLRLARAAAIALPLLTLLYAGVAARARRQVPAVYWGRIGMVCGAVGMPVLLAAAALTSTHLKLLLAIPADAVFGGTLVGVWLARRYARPLEFWGWLLVVLSMAAGLLMGSYAFDGPLPSPAFLGAYGDFPRRLTRLAHAYAIVLGLLCIFAARELEQRSETGRKARWWERQGALLLAAGSATTIGAILLLAITGLPPALLSLGPVLVAAGTLLCITPLVFGPDRALFPP